MESGVKQKGRRHMKRTFGMLLVTAGILLGSYTIIMVTTRGVTSTPVIRLTRIAKVLPIFRKSAIPVYGVVAIGLALVGFIIMDSPERPRLPRDTSR